MALAMLATRPCWRQFWPLCGGMIYAQGIAPLLRPAARRLTAQTLRTVDWITVRDAESAAELRRIGLNGGSPPVEVAADPVFALEPASRDRAERELRAVRDS